MKEYLHGPVVTVTVADTSVGLLAETLQPTSGELQGRNLEGALIQAVGPLYIETGGGAATTASYPMAAGDSITIYSYRNLRNLRMIRNTNSTTAVIIPMYR